MPSPVHEIPVARLAPAPALLPALAEKLLGRRLPRRRPIDSTVRVADPEEVRPDLILARGKRGPWDAVEVQRRIDPSKRRRWPLLVSALHSQRRCMGDLWVITASPRTEAWARTACDAAGPKGTRQRLEPVVLLVGPEQVEALLDEGRPSLAFFAAWAMQGRYGPASVDVVERALAVTDHLPLPLRREQGQAILGVLNRRMVATLKEKIMDAKRSVESRWVREMREELFGEEAARHVAKLAPQFRAEGEAAGKAHGKQDSVLKVLERRGLAVSAAQRAVVLACDDVATLDRWLVGAVDTASVRELLGPGSPRKNGRARPGAAAHRARRATRAA
jgi:hypothetical protein